MTLEYLLKAFITFTLLSISLYGILFLAKKFQKKAFNPLVEIIDFKPLKNLQIYVLKIYGKKYIVATNQNSLKVLDTLEV